MAKRKKTPPDVETEVLLMSARRCCICYGIDGDFSEKSGQIAHLDSDPSNFRFDNLAWLCLPHHDKYDSKTSQSKGITIHEVKRYRALLHDKVGETLRKTTRQSAEQRTSREQKVIESETSSLLAKIQSLSVPLSQCLAEVLALARATNTSALEEFCRNELSGYIGKDTSIPTYRVIDVFISPLGRINMQYVGWDESGNAILSYMEQHPDQFLPFKFGLGYSVSEIESYQKEIDAKSGKGVISFNLRMGDVVPNAENPKRPTPAYGRPNSIRNILDSIRRELTNRLLSLLPDAK